ncbi:MAG: LysR family transcriptional regulator [Azonexus sp.]|nr:LysR family transcriptional regulator [Azonexus sp.]MCK6413218.1 LysR family transcriptional regulator [Azonexus sp.]
MKITLDQLRILDAIEHHGSFSAAAGALHRVPSAISHAIGKLENDLGFPLFEREGRKTQLNAAGRSLLEDGRHLLRAAHEMERRAQRIATGWEAELRIAVDMLIPAERLYPLLADFLAAGQATQVRLSYEVLGGTWDALATGRADLVIGAPGDLPPRGGIATRPLGHIRLLPLAAPDHPLAGWTRPIPDEELRRHRAIAIADTSQELHARTVWLQEGQPVLRVPDMRAKAAAQVAGLGIGHLPRWLAEPEIAAGRLVELKLAEPRPATPCHIAWKSRRQGLALDWFLRALEEPRHLAAISRGL